MAKTRAENAATDLRRRRWTASEAKKVLKAQEESGLTVSAFAAREGLCVHRLFRWRRRLSASEPERPRFEEVVPRKTAPWLAEPTAPAGNRLEIVLCSGLIIRVAESFNEDALRRLLGVVDGGRAC